MRSSGRTAARAPRQAVEEVPGAALGWVWKAASLDLRVDWMVRKKCPDCLLDLT